MFDLEKEVAAWSRSAVAEGCRSAGSAAELRDHLYCEIDRARATGLTDEQAFRAAVATLGSESQLAAEHARNRSWLARVCAYERRNSKGMRSDLLIAHAVIWASLILATSLFLSKSTTRNTTSLMITLVFVPMWLASEQILRHAMRRTSRNRRQ